MRKASFLHKALVLFVSAMAGCLLLTGCGGAVKDLSIQPDGQYSFTAGDDSYTLKVYNDSDVVDGKVTEGAQPLGTQTANGGTGQLTCVPFGGPYAVVLSRMDASYNEKQVATLNGYEKYGKLTAPELSYQEGVPYINTVNRIELNLEYAMTSEALTTYEIETYLDEGLTQKVPEGCGQVTPTVTDGQISGNYLEFTPEVGNTYYFRCKALANEASRAEESDWGPVATFVAMAK